MVAFLGDEKSTLFLMTRSDLIQKKGGHGSGVAFFSLTMQNKRGCCSNSGDAFPRRTETPEYVARPKVIAKKIGDTF
jgi:hypothetical protein